jgi:misacylated tRNA(Ala) deacylase
MTEPLYQTNAYLKEFDAQVTAVDPDAHAVALDRSAFYPGGGGQPADQGWITHNGVRHPVTAKRHNGDTFHFFPKPSKLPTVGDTVLAKLDWDLRYKHMRTHTAMHILCGVVFRDYGAQVTGGNMEPLQGRMDFEFEHMKAELVAEIETAINAEVANARDLRVAILPREEAFAIPDLIRTKINLLPEAIQEVRIVEIIGLDLQADGGTHVANTREVGKLKVADYKSKGAINKRIYVELED